MALEPDGVLTTTDTPLPGPPDGAARSAHVWRYCLGIAAVACIVYLPVIRAGFLESWDDGPYLLANKAVRAPDGLTRIWTTLELPEGFPNYPLVFTSYWLEYHLWGFNPTGFHLTNILLHALNAVLVFLVLRSLSAPDSVAAVVAFLFAVHPVQVESVAWITERKNLLYVAFGLAAFLAFRRHRKTPSASAYLLCLSLYVLALLSKTAAVTLVASLVLADWIVDRRRDLRSCLPLLPMLILGLIGVYLTSRVEHEAGVVSVALLLRPLLIARTMWFYVGKLIWPYPLLPVYPKWDGLVTSADPWAFDWPSWEFWLASAALVATVTLILLLRRRLHPLALWGIGHFAVTILPVSGLVDFGYFSHTFVADRFVYLAGLGLFLPIVMLARRFLLQALPAAPRKIATASSLLLLILLGSLTWKQASLWADQLLLWQHTLRFNETSHDVHNACAVALTAVGRTDEAIEHYQRALQLCPNYVKYLNNLGIALARKGRHDQAVALHQQALKLRPKDASTLFDLGCVYMDMGRADQAIHYFRQAIEVAPLFSSAYHNLGSVLVGQGRLSEAVTNFVTVLKIDPDFERAYDNLAMVYAQQGDFVSVRQILKDAMHQFGRNPKTLDALAWLLATCPQDDVRDGREALSMAEQACRMERNTNPRHLATLAAAHAELGQLDLAIKTAREALYEVPRPNDPATLLLNRMLAAFQAGKPFRSTSR